MPQASRRPLCRPNRWFLLPAFVAGAIAVAGVAGAQGPAPVIPGAPPETQTPPQAPPDEASLVVGTILVTGNTFTDTERILRTYELERGKPFSPDLARRGLRKLLSLGLFSDVHVDQKVHDGLIDLTIVVRERPRIAKISFVGQKKREDSDLEKKLFLKSGETYSLTTTQTQIDSLELYYRDEGFPRAKIKAKADTLVERNAVNLTFLVNEGEKLRIVAISFAGDRAFPEKRLRKVMKTKKKGFFGGGGIKDETFPEDREKLEAWYHDHGYRDMSVTSFELVPGAVSRDLTLKVTLDEGHPFEQGNVTWSGNQVVPTATLQKLWPRKGGTAYDKSRIEKAQQAAYSEYSEHGYLYLGVEPKETVRADSIVDVDFAITENAPSHIRLVSITGNKGTREKVIRRELSIHEGDLFRRSALMRSRDDLTRLGLFTDVTPDFTPAESTDVDLVFKVAEKQVGTASAGAGYTNEAGVTGFLEIGHNNVLGNGQSLALHLERGGKTENYSLSFTEPWFHDSPTLLGLSAYNTLSQLVEFDQRRRGASGRIGRPLPWPDYSRGSVSYTLESTEISNVSSGITLGGITLNKPQLTSSFETDFVRNSADQPFYPTKGTRFTASDEFTGGVLGGDLNFHLHRYEGRAYVPSIVKHVTTMVRLRLGLVGQYPWRSGPFPDYVRFRLGGGNTPDPLRGYMDYQVVPGKFVKDVVTGRTIVSIDSTTTPGVRDTTFKNITERRRYPGGAYMGLFTFEQQFPIAPPLHGLLFFDAGNTWDLRQEIKPLDLKVGAGFGFRIDIPLLGNIGFDYGYGFQRDDRPRWQGHFMLGNVNF